MNGTPRPIRCRKWKQSEHACTSGPNTRTSKSFGDVFQTDRQSRPDAAGSLDPSMEEDELKFISEDPGSALFEFRSIYRVCAGYLWRRFLWMKDYVVKWNVLIEMRFLRLLSKKRWCDSIRVDVLRSFFYVLWDLTKLGFYPSFWTFIFSVIKPRKKDV